VKAVLDARLKERTGGVFFFYGRKKDRYVSGRALSKLFAAMAGLTDVLGAFSKRRSVENANAFFISVDTSVILDTPDTAVSNKCIKGRCLKFPIFTTHKRVYCTHLFLGQSHYHM
tara:strand:- start:1526 stop:1870 length:345 start_codon:yes stop_codon:yes gene_type:complete